MGVGEEGEKMKKIFFSALFILFFSLIFVSNSNANDMENLERINSYDVIYSSSQGTVIFYSNTADGNSLYKYVKNTGQHIKMNNARSTNIKAFQHGEETLIFFTNQSDNSTTWIYNDTTKFTKRIISNGSIVYNPIVYNDQFLIFYINRNIGRLSLYNMDTNSNSTLSPTVYMSKDSVIEYDNKIKLYYINKNDGNKLYEFDYTNNIHKAITNFAVSETGYFTKATEEGVKVYFTNNSDKKIYSYDVSTNKTSLVINKVGYYPHPIESDEGLKIIYSDGNKVIEHNTETGEEKELYETNISSLQVINTPFGYETYAHDTTTNKIFTYSENTKKYEEISQLSFNKTHNSIFLNWINPEHEEFVFVKIYKDGQFYKQLEANYQFYLFEELTPDTEYTFLITSNYDDGFETPGIQAIIKTNKLPEITDLENEIQFNFISSTFKLPEINDFEHIEIYLDDFLIDEIHEDFYEFKGLEENTKYQLKFVVVDNRGNKSEGITVEITTPEAPKKPEIEKPKATAKYNRVDLSWKNPDNPNFEFVRIYRKKVSEETSFINQLLFGKVVQANEIYQPLFETNGTYFNDLTVQPETTYEYKLTTENKEGEESAGVIIQATTTEEPEPQMAGIIETTNENGDYVYSWTSPTEGEVKIFVGGKEFATVPASDGQITIQAADMKYSVLNNPDVQLQPISPSGKPGTKTKAGLSGVSLPFGAGDLLSSSMGLFGVLGSFILLVLAVRFAPKLFALIKKSAANKQAANNRRSRS